MFVLLLFNFVFLLPLFPFTTVHCFVSPQLPSYVQLLKHYSFPFIWLQLSFQMWTDQMQETLNSKKKGDVAFKQKDFGTAIECYSQVKLLL